jgi:hypothetical protein
VDIMPLSIDITKLVLAPFLQDNIIDGETREPAIGQVFYYKAGCPNCPKPIYIETGDPQDPFVESPNPIPLDAAGSIPYYTWAYPFDENDASVPELYDVVVKRLDNTEILRRDNWPPMEAGGSTPTEEPGNTLNLCGNYEFHSMVNEDIYSIFPVDKNVTNVCWGWQFVLDDATKYNLHYESVLLNQGAATDVEQTPLNELIVRFENTQGTSGKRYLSFHLGTYNAFQGKYIYISEYLRNINATPSLDVLIYRVNSGVVENPINLGTLTIPSSSLEKVELTVQIPDITATGYDVTDRIHFALSPPENVDCSFGITANWYQVVEKLTDKGSASRLPLGLSRANAFFKEPDLNNASDGTIPNSFNLEGDQTEDGLALTVSEGRRDVLVRTGTIEHVAINSVHQINGAVELTEEDDYMIYDNVIPNEAGQNPKVARANRLIYELYHSNLNPRHSFAAAQIAADTAEVSLLGGDTFKTAWTTNNPAAIVLTPKLNPHPYEVIATKTAPDKLKLQYAVDTFTPPNQFQTDYPECFTTSGPPDSGYPIPPVNNIGNWFQKDFEDATTPPYGDSSLFTQVNIAAGGGLGVGLELTFTDTDPTKYVPTKKSFVIPPSTSYDTITKYNNFIEIPASTEPNLRAHPYTRSHPAATGVVPGSVHLVWSNKTPSSQYIKGKKATAVIDISSGVPNTEALIDKTVSTFNTGEATDVKFNTLPNHGDWIKFSNDIDDYTLQFLEQGQPTPALETGNRRLFLITFNPTLTTEELVKIIVEKFPIFMRALPTLSELGLSPFSDSTTFMMNL